ncbi:transcriptional regulator [Parafrankia colletiae]|uniref:Transcriptional regulator n=1 Tax=Parafrankia colletiae TaxID=573497 RepID=A0A1S1QXQ3_9ACTN|nr:transcriptional regulator [Parafrankia colletiae]
MRDVGDFIREQRRGAQISLRQLARQAGVSNPYLSQIERGLRRPSAEILQQIAKALRISAEVLYVQAGILEEREGGEDLLAAVHADDTLTERQKQVIVDIYDAFRRENALAGAGSTARLAAMRPAGTDAETDVGPADENPVVDAEPAAAEADVVPDVTTAPAATATASTAAGSPGGAGARPRATGTRRATRSTRSPSKTTSTSTSGTSNGAAGTTAGGSGTTAAPRRSTARKSGDGRRAPRSSGTKAATEPGGGTAGPTAPAQPPSADDGTT